MTDEQFRLHVREWFEANYPQEWRFPNRRLNVKEAMPWFAKLHEKGWVAPAWPKEYGGMGLSAYQQIIFQEELDRIGAFYMPNGGVGLLGPMLIRYGSEEQKAHFLPKILSHEHIWAQGYSEPGAGSDLAALNTSAVRDGDEYVINGSKIWTSMAQHSNWIFMLVRTDKEVKKQKGISFLLVPMDTPGIEYREIDNIGLYSEFCQVFFDDVRVPVSSLVGEENEGWTMAKSLLGSERIMLGSPKLAKFPLQRLESMAREFGLFDDPIFCEKFTRLSMDVDDAASAFVRFVEVLKRGDTLGTEVSMLKIWITETFQRVADLILEASAELGCQEQAMALLDGSNFKPTNPYYTARPATIYGGSNEIQRNILAKTILKLP